MLVPCPTVHLPDKKGQSERLGFMEHRMRHDVAHHEARHQIDKSYTSYGHVIHHLLVKSMDTGPRRSHQAFRLAGNQPG